MTTIQKLVLGTLLVLRHHLIDQQHSLYLSPQDMTEARVRQSILGIRKMLPILNWQNELINGVSTYAAAFCIARVTLPIKINRFKR